MRHSVPEPFLVGETKMGEVRWIAYGVTRLDSGVIMYIKRAQMMGMERRHRGGPTERVSGLFFDETEQVGSCKSNEVVGYFFSQWIVFHPL